MDSDKVGDFLFDASSTTINGHYYSHITLSPPEKFQKKPSCIIAVLDISGSMDQEATQGNSKQSDGFSRLDLVKHSVNTIIHSLNEDDYLGIVTFSNNARVDFQISKMNADGKTNALEMTKKMRTEGATNLWDGIRLGLQESQKQICKGKNTFVVVLSDGEPNQHPPKGELITTKEYIESHPLSCSMSMFGYGYSLDTKLLSALTELGGGCYGYIPDCSMVGTIFVNFLSTVLSTYTSAVTVDVHSSVKLKSLNGQEGRRAKLGPIQYGAKRNILLEFEGGKEGDELANVTLYYGEKGRNSQQFAVTHTGNSEEKSIRSQIMRYKYINFLAETCSNFNLASATQKANNLIKEMKETLEVTKDQYLSRMLRDLQSPKEQEGQVKIALSKQQYWTKWGVHYYPALKIAHQIEMCTNFKDPGIQLYAGTVCKNYQNTIDTIFIKLPPPEPSIKKYDSNGNLKVVDDMADYYDEYGGCIGEGSMVKMGDGTFRKVENLKKDDVIETLNGEKAKIRCVMMTKLSEDVEMVVFPSGLMITKYHPVIYGGKWQFPTDIFKPKKVNISAYYNFVLDKGHTMTINGIQCVTLGHNFVGDVIEHDYLGSEKVLRDLEKAQSWKDGCIELKRQAWRRDPSNKRINGLMI